jgi:hypothetical protein
MLTLIKREIYDNIAYFVAAIILSLIIIIITLSAATYNFDPEEAPVFAIGLSLPVIVILVIGFTSMGVSQMYIDKNKKISAFLSTLPVTRGRILTARIIAGILAILTFFLPVIITSSIVYRLFTPPIPIYEGIFFDIYTVTLLTSFACYCIGLQTGWKTGKLIPTMGGLFLTCVLVPIIIIKGFDLQVSLLLIIFIIASLIRISLNFMTTPL